MDYKALAQLLFPNVTETPEEVEARFPARDLPEGAIIETVSADFLNRFAIVCAWNLKCCATESTCA